MGGTDFFASYLVTWVIAVMVRYQTNSHRDNGSIECIGKYGIAVEEVGYMCPHLMHVIEMSFNADQFVNTDECTRPPDAPIIQSKN